jgi:integrase/recombinase XerD
MPIKIVNGKGKKGRFVSLSPVVLLQLSAYYIQYRPTIFLFNGAREGKKHAVCRIHHIRQNTLAKIGLDSKNYSVDSIRHSFATHLIGNCADIQLIQELLGHHHISQTTQYLHLSSKRMNPAVDPFDAMMAQMNNTNTLNKTT